MLIGYLFVIRFVASCSYLNNVSSSEREIACKQMSAAKSIVSEICFTSDLVEFPCNSAKL